ncbi:MAG: hypothetical protein RR806_07865 [Oscillospiraceae bacterium]
MTTLKQTIFDDIIESIVPRLTLTRCKNSNQKVFLVAKDDNIILTDGSLNNYYASIPHEINYNNEMQKIHGNTRNSLAKEFINSYPIDYILQLESAFIVQKQAEEKQFKIEQKEMERIYNDEILPLFKDTRLNKQPEYNVWWGNCEPLIQFECKFENPLSRWNGEYTNKIEVFFDNHSLNKFAILTGIKSGRSDRVKGLSIEEVKAECYRIISECEDALQVYNNRLKEANDKWEEEMRLSHFASEIYYDKEKVTILRKKNNFTVVGNRMKFSTGTGKCGKYYDTSVSQIMDMIKDKGYTEYYQEPREVFEMRNDEALCKLEWSKVPA